VFLDKNAKIAHSAFPSAVVVLPIYALLLILKNWVDKQKKKLAFCTKWKKDRLGEVFFSIIVTIV